MKRPLPSISLTLLLFLISCAPQPTDPDPKPSPDPTIAVLATTAPAVEITATPEAVTSPDYFNLPADSVELDATRDEINQVLHELSGMFINFPDTYDKSTGTYGISCVLEKINFLKEGSYVNVGEFDIRVTGDCSFLDVNGEKQTALVALVIQNTDRKTTWVPNRSAILPGVFATHFIQEYFNTSIQFEPGIIIDVLFNLPNETNLTVGPAATHHGSAVSKLYTQEEIEEYVKTGDSQKINGLLVPFIIAKNGLYQPFEKP